MELTLYQIDAFTEEVFKGNYAAVIIVEEWLSGDLMQKIASENNVSETAFVKLISNNHYAIRWFSPLCEIDFCGHATLASAFVLFNNTQHNNLIFSADAVGEVTITKKKNGLISMLFPNTFPVVINNVPEALLSGLSIQPREVLKNNQAYFAIYENEQQIHQITANASQLKKLAPYDVVVSSKADKVSDYDFISRYFWPANGGDEDAVTGSIHTGLAPYWAKLLGKNNLKAYQASIRGGLLYCKVLNNKVEISGKAVQYLKGVITIA